MYLNKANNSNNDLASEYTVAKMLNIAPRTLQDWRRKGIGPNFIRVGRQIRYDLADINQWISKHKKNGGNNVK